MGTRKGGVKPDPNMFTDLRFAELFYRSGGLLHHAIYRACDVTRIMYKEKRFWANGRGGWMGEWTDGRDGWAN